MKTHGGAETFLTSALDWGAWSASCPGRFTSGEIATGAHWIGDWVGPRVGLDLMEKKQISCPCRVSNPIPRLSSPQLSRYTDWAIPAVRLLKDGVHYATEIEQSYDSGSSVAPRDPKPRMSVLRKASRKLPDHTREITSIISMMRSPNTTAVWLAPLLRSAAQSERSALSITRNLHTDVISQPAQNRNVSYETVGTASGATASLSFVIPCLIFAISHLSCKNKPTGFAISVYLHGMIRQPLKVKVKLSLCLSN
jgi:hypothetical protein